MKPVQFPIEVLVRDGSSGHTTQAVAGQRASSTNSAAVAVERLVDKLTAHLALPIGMLRARKLRDVAVCVTAWRIEIDTTAGAQP